MKRERGDVEDGDIQEGGKRDEGARRANEGGVKAPLV